MSVDENLRAVDRWAEAYNARDFEAFENSFTESAIYHTPSLPLKGRGEIRKHYEAHPVIFPDAHLAKIRSFGQGDWVCVEFIWTATNTGPLPGPGGQTIPATNRSVRIQFVIVVKFDGGKIAEAREYFDRLDYNDQLGLKTWRPFLQRTGCDRFKT